MQTNFRRYELKYKLTKADYERLLQALPSDMHLDSYGRHKISNIYFRIIRHSLEKPKYKEKLRVRCYGLPSEEGTAFIELKKKFNGVVYKRRVYDKQKHVLAHLCDNADSIEKTQILNEINYFKRCYADIKPKVYLSYEREAFYSTGDENFRLTVDFNIKTRDRDIGFHDSEEDLFVLPQDYVIVEVKTVMGLPAWFLRFLSENRLYKTSFSKYGTAYEQYFSPHFINTLGRVANA